MSYFDHVRCHHCKAMLDPERISAGMTCPQCGNELALSDLFGLKDAFQEEEGPELSLDDLLAPGRNNPFAEDPLRQGRPPEPSPRAGRPAARPTGGAPSRPAGPRGPQRPALGSGPSAAPPGSTHMVPVPRSDDDDDRPGGTPSALELMRKMKKRK